MIAPYLVHVAVLVCVYVILSLSLNLSLGFSGYLNLGHVALFGIGAYTSALLNTSGVNFILCLISSGIVSGAFGFALIFGTKRLKGDYYALASLGFAFVVNSLLLNLVGLTRGPLGVTGIPKPNIFGFIIKNNFTYLMFVLAILFLSLLFFYKLTKSPFGKLLEAMRDDEMAVRSFGKNADKLKFKAMTISAVIAGISGSLFAHYIGYIDPGMFYINEIILVITIVIIGGLASIKGSVVAGILVISISEFLRFVNLPSSYVGPGRQIMYALILIIVLLRKPRGLYGRVDLE